MLPAIIGGGMALGSLIGDHWERNEAEKNQQKAIQAMKELIIPRADTERRADRYGDNFYTKSMGELNKGAFAYKGALNPETLRTMAFGEITAGRAATEMQVEEADYGYNKQIEQQIAGIKAQPLPSVNPMNALEAGVGGYFAGRQLDMSEKLMGQHGKYYEALEKDVNKNKGIDNTGYFNINTNQNLDYGYISKPNEHMNLWTGQWEKKKPVWNPRIGG